LSFKEQINNMVSQSHCTVINSVHIQLNPSQRKCPSVKIPAGKFLENSRLTNRNATACSCPERKSSCGNQNTAVSLAMSVVRGGGDDAASYIGSGGVEALDEAELVDKMWAAFKQGMFGVLVRFEN
jgi:hypothetical protein